MNWKKLLCVSRSQRRRQPNRKISKITEGLEERVMLTSILDVDADTQTLPLTDGLLTIRHLAGFSGSNLVNNATSSEGDRTEATEISDYLDTIAGQLDIDGDGRRLPLTDGLLTIRYLAGFQGQSLIAGAVNPDGQRTTESEILQHFENLSPEENTPPEFAPVDDISITVGDRFSVQLAATDADSDPVTFSLAPSASLPPGMLTADGKLTLTPGPNDVGSQQLTLIASDGKSETRLNVPLTVTADPLTTTRLSGRVMDTEEMPLVGVRVSVGNVDATTDATMATSRSTSVKRRFLPRSSKFTATKFPATMCIPSSPRIFC